MTWNVISPQVGRETAEVLQSYLNIQHPIEREVKINWGCSILTRHDPAEVWGNKPVAIGRSVNKKTMHTICKDLGIVPVITTFEGPCYQHHDVAGHNGSGVVFVTNLVDFTPGVHTTKQIKGQEFRVYFCYDMTPLIYAKVPLTEDIPHSPIQNSFNGYGYMPATSFFKEISGLQQVLKEQTKKVASRLELSYGAIDFIMSQDYTVYVLESNSAPTLFNESLCESFATSIAEVWNV